MRVVRPRDLSDEKRQEITRYLLEQWRRAEDGRRSQVDSDFDRWDKLYRAIPAEKERIFPWKGASNLVVPIIRIHLDTFVAHTLGTVFGTHPLIKVEGMPEEHSNALEDYLNYKSVQRWEFFQLAWDWVQAGNKNGTAVVKSTWVEDVGIDVMPAGDGEYTEEEVPIYSGPRPEVIPFEDYFVYPITATRPHHILIHFHRVRYVDEQVKEMCDSGKWPFEFEGEDGLKRHLKVPSDMKRASEQSEANVSDSYLHELHTVECHFRYELSGKHYHLVGVLLPDGEKLLDLYFAPQPRNVDLFASYRPFPRESLYFGESLSQILWSIQEECSQIHNDRRNNSTIANTPQFVRKNGSLIANPSTSWYPGKVWDVENIDDFQALNVGRNYDSMLDQENWGLQLAERLTGFPAAMQGSAQGFMGKRGMYSSQGTLALMSENNQRSGQAVRIFRESFAQVAKTSFLLQKAFGADDPDIEYFPKQTQDRIRKALAYADLKRTHMCPFVIRTSSASLNIEAERTNLMQMAGTLNQHYGQVMQMAQQLLNPGLNPGLRAIYNDILAGQKQIAARLLRAFNEIDPEGVLPDVAAAIERVIPGGGQGTRTDEGDGSAYPGGVPPAGGPLSRPGLESLLSLPGGDEAPGGVEAA